MVITLTAITKKQWGKVLKAVIYAFVSAAGGVLAVTNFSITKTTLTAAAIAGINAVLVAIWQIFQQDEQITLPIAAPQIVHPTTQIPVKDAPAEPPAPPATAA